MGRSRKPRAKRTDSESDNGDPSKTVIFLSSSDDEEANKDFSSEIIQRARELELKRKWEGDGGTIQISPDSSEDFEMNFDRNDSNETAKSDHGAVEEPKKNKSKSKGKKKKKKELGEEPVAAVDALSKEEELVGTGDSVVTEVNEISDNAVLRKLLRGPRYFDPGDRNSQACFNCGEEGHTAANCTMERRKRPCFVCGMFGHNAKSCTKGQDCYICKRRGHIAKNCPDKHKRTSKDSLVCLRCGELGHDMLSCENDYATEDLKEIQCYVCKNYGHLCCVDFTDDGPREVSCYNCAQSGHSGLGCAKLRGEINEPASPTLCYKCGEQGHFARGCTKYSKAKAKHIKFDRWEGGSSPLRGFASESRDSLGFRSAPHDMDRVNNKKKKKLQDEDRWNMTAAKPRARGGWIVDDDPDDLPRRKHKANRWQSPSTPRAFSSASSEQYSASSQSPFKKRKPFLGTPNYNASTSGHHRGYYSASRYGKSQDYYERY